MSEIYISFDVETVGGSTSKNWMPNIGLVAATPDGTILSELSVNMTRPPGTESDPETLAWFHGLDNGYTWRAITHNAFSPLDGMTCIRAWVNELTMHGKIIFVAYPTIFDGSWLYHYWFTYLGHPTNGVGPGFNMIDIRSYAAGKLGISYAEANKKTKLARFCPPADQFPHTHTGLDDAREQLQLFLNIKNSK